MADETNGAGQVPAASTTADAAQGQVSAASTNTTTTPTEPTAGTSTSTTADTSTAGEPSLTLEQALDALKKARGDAAKNRVDGKRLAELEEAQRKADLAKLDDRQRLEKELADLQTKHADIQRASQERIIRAEVRAHAASVGVPPELASRLLDYSEIKFDDDGEPQNIGDLLKALIKQYPQLAVSGGAAAKPQPTSVGNNPANPPRSTANSGAWSYEYIESLSSRQIADLPADRRLEMLNWMAVNPKRARPQ